ncbi:MAG: CARDB domain-containing protein, partial [Candidatus Aenigmatarchaeota archaeon]
MMHMTEAGAIKPSATKSRTSWMFAAAVVSLVLIYPLLCVPAADAAYVSMSVSGQTVPSGIGPGENGNLVFTITNAGTEYARNVKLFVKPNGQMTFSQQNYDLQTIAPSTSAQVSVPIKISASATEGATTVFLSLSYAEGSSVGTSTTETSVSVSISKRSLVQIEVVSWSKDPIEPGNVVNASMRLKNVGASDLSYMTVTLDDSSQPFVAASGDTEAYVGSLGRGSVATAEFSIIVNRDAKTVAYRIPVFVKYYDESGTFHNDTKYIGMKVSGMPDFVVTLEDDSRAYAGTEGELTISIANRGTATANFLTLRFDSDLAITPAEYYVGNLDPDDYQTVKLNADFSGVSPGRRTLSISMHYKDPYNSELSETASVEFKLRQPVAGPVSPLFLAAVVA